MFEGWNIVARLAGHADRVIPGHDPIVTEIYPRTQRSGRCLCIASAAVALVFGINPRSSFRGAAKRRTRNP
jgi:hypothetical protein